MIKLLQGVAIGMAIVLPGLSGGTAIIIFGFYREFLRDLSRLSMRPYLPLLLGSAAGILLGISTIAFLLEHYHTLMLAFFLGMLIASLRIIAAHAGIKKIRALPLLSAAAGFTIAWFLFQPLGGTQLLAPGSLPTYFVGGAISSALMLLPGVSGGSVLIALGIYDDIILALYNIYWPALLPLTAGFAVGLLGFARLLTILYRRHADLVSFVLFGLILGSLRALIPEQINPGVVAATLVGIFLVLIIDRSTKYKQDY